MGKIGNNAIDVFTDRLLEVQPEVKAFISAVLAAYPDDIRDVVQETNLAMVRHADEYRSDQRMLPWAIAFAKNQIRAYRLKHARDRLVFDEALLDAYAEAAFAPAEGCPEPSDRARHLLKCLERLPERQRHLINLRYEKGWSAETIARLENHSAKALRTALYKARQRLADCMSRLCRLGPDASEASDDGSKPDALAERIGQAVDTPPPSDGFRDLVSTLRESAGARQAYADQMLVHTLLRDYFEVKNRCDEIRSLVQANQPKRRFGWMPFLRWAAGAALLLGGIAYALVSFSPRKQAAETVSEPVSAPEPEVQAALPPVVAPVQPVARLTNELAAVPAALTREGEESMMKTQVVAAVAATVTAVAAPAVLMKAGTAVAASTASTAPMTVASSESGGYAASLTSNAINLETRRVAQETVSSCNLEARYRAFLHSNNSNLNATRLHGFSVSLQ